MIRVAILLLAASTCAAQRLSVGVKGGLRLTDDIEGAAVSESKRYVVGPMVEVALPHRFAVEGNALYSRFGYRTGNSDILGGFYAEIDRANVWEFPVLLKYRLRALYAAAGYAPRVMHGQFHVTGFSGGTARGNYDFSGATSFDTTHGLVAGAGIEFGRGHVRLAPEVRYIRWNADPIHISGSRGFFIGGLRNEVRLQVGVSYRRASR